MAHRSETNNPADNRIDDVVSYLHQRYELVILPVLMAFMFWTRYRSRGNFLGGDTISLAAVDSYYHWRTTLYTVQNWPNTMPYDVWTNFPDGRYVGQFGTGFDQIIATVALIVGLGNPSEAIVHETVLFAIPLLAAFVAIPVYFIGKRLGGRLAGIAAVVLLALSPGTFFSRSAVGQHQHHVAEVLFMAIAILAFMYALRVAEREKPVFEQVLDRDIEGLRTTIGYSALAGVALAAYMWMWPPGTLLIGIIGVFFVVYLSIEYAAGRSPEHLAFVGAISFAVTSILMFGVVEEFSTSPTSFGYIAPVLALCVALGCVYMAAIAREWEKQDLDRLLYPVGIAVSVVIALGILWLLLPDVVERMFGDIQRRMMPFGESPTDLTIQEAQPPANFSDQAFREFGLAFYTAIIGLIGLVVAPFLGQRAKAEHGLIVVWAIFLISMSTAQIRFWYYLILPVVVLNAYLLGHIFRWADLDFSMDSLRSVEGYQIMVFAVILMVLVVPLMPPVANATVVDHSTNQGPHPDSVKWGESLDYLEGSTPEVGDWAGEGNQFDYDGTYSVPDGSWDYPDGSYGIMSWWDYGHLITTQSERIPLANPFQTGASEAAAYLLAEDEAHGNDIMDAIATDLDLDQDPEDLAAGLEEYDDDEIEDFRYVMVDDGMASGKFDAIATWNDEEKEDYTEQANVTLLNGESAQGEVMSDRYYDTMVGSLYYDDASGMENYRLVHESEAQSQIASVGVFDNDGQFIPLITHAEMSSIQQGLAQSNINFEQFPPQFYNMHQVPAVKTFEQVEGATITGQSDAAPGSEVQAEIPLNTTHRTISYSQNATVDDDGSFELTVPYATNDELGTADGYTESDVYAEDDAYAITVEDGNETVVENGSVTIPEGAIYDGDEVTVDLEEVEDENGDADNGENGEEENGENGDADDGDETNGDANDGDADNETEPDDGDADNETVDNQSVEAIDPDRPLSVLP